MEDLSLSQAWMDELILLGDLKHEVDALPVYESGRSQYAVRRGDVVAALQRIVPEFPADPLYSVVQPEHLSPGVIFHHERSGISTRIVECAESEAVGPFVSFGSYSDFRRLCQAVVGASRGDGSKFAFPDGHPLCGLYLFESNYDELFAEIESKFRSKDLQLSSPLLDGQDCGCDCGDDLQQRGVLG